MDDGVDARKEDGICHAVGLYCEIKKKKQDLSRKFSDWYRVQGTEVSL